jgi:hypothetical protein
MIDIIRRIKRKTFNFFLYRNKKLFRELYNEISSQQNNNKIEALL